MKEHLELQRLHNILQRYCGSSTMDPERHFKVFKRGGLNVFITKNHKEIPSH